MSKSSRATSLRRFILGAAIASVFGALPQLGHATETVLMSGLANPRGIAIGPDGGVYVAEGGSGGSLGTYTSLIGPQDYGATGSVSRLLNGVQSRVYTGLPSVAPVGSTAEAVGPSGLAFDSSGQLNIIVGLGGMPSVRTNELNGLQSANLLGQIVRPTSSNTYTAFSDIAAYEGAHDPDGAGVDTDPYGIAALPGGKFAVVDAGGDDLLLVNSTGTITQSVVFPARANPTPVGGPTYETVPTNVAVGPNGNLFVSELTGFPFPIGAAQIDEVNTAEANPAPSVFASGFTTLTGLSFGPDGSLYAIEIDKQGLLTPSGMGEMVRIAPDGTQTVISSDLPDPTGILVGSNGNIYASINGTSATDGEVVEFTSASTVPLPKAAWEILAASPVVAFATRRYRAKTVR